MELTLIIIVLCGLIIWFVIGCLASPPYFPVAAEEKWLAIAVVTNPFSAGRAFHCGSWADKDKAIRAAKAGAKYLDLVVPTHHKEPLCPTGFTWTPTEFGIKWYVILREESPHKYLNLMSEARGIYAS